MNIKIKYRDPKKDDAKYIFKLIKDSGRLDVNSEYLYLLQSTHFKDTCCVATDHGKIVGFASGYLIPNDCHTLFIWQIVVDEKYRGHSIAQNMISEIMSRKRTNPIFNIYATVSSDNTASNRVFEKIAKELDVSITKETLFKISDFEHAHEAEILYKIGPIKL